MVEDDEEAELQRLAKRQSAIERLSARTRARIEKGLVTPAVDDAKIKEVRDKCTAPRLTFDWQQSATQDEDEDGLEVMVPELKRSESRRDFFKKAALRNLNKEKAKSLITNEEQIKRDCVEEKLSLSATEENEMEEMAVAPNWMSSDSAAAGPQRDSNKRKKNPLEGSQPKVLRVGEDEEIDASAVLSVNPDAAEPTKSDDSYSRNYSEAGQIQTIVDDKVQAAAAPAGPDAATSAQTMTSSLPVACCTARHLQRDLENGQ